MDVKEYLQNPCGTLSIPYWKAKTLAIPDSMRIIHCSNWNGQYGNFQRFFRIKHYLNDLSPIDYDYDTLSIDYQATQLCEMINESYKHENIVVSEQDILQWKQHKTFREELCVYMNADNGKMAASGIAEFDEVCREDLKEVLTDLFCVIAVGLADEPDGIRQQDVALRFLRFVFLPLFVFLEILPKICPPEQR